jgi:four helix bundle protein
MSNFRELRVWQRGMDLIERVYGFTRTLPSVERFGVSSQIQRAAISIPSNAAEGHSRQRLGAYINHISIALGSSAELETLFEACRRLRMGDPESLLACEECLGDVSRMLHGLHSSLERAAQMRKALIYSILLASPVIWYFSSLI